MYDLGGCFGSLFYFAKGFSVFAKLIAKTWKAKNLINHQASLNPHCVFGAKPNSVDKRHACEYNGIS